MIIINEKINFTTNDLSTHKNYNFYLDEDYKELHIDFNYSPLDVGRKISETECVKAIMKYVPAEVRSYELLEYARNTNIQNFITVSVVHNKKYLGCRHNKESHKKILISENNSSLGYIKHKIAKGDYTVSLNCHIICTSMNAEIKIEVLK